MIHLTIKLIKLGLLKLCNTLYFTIKMLGNKRMTFYDIHELKNVKATGEPFLINDLTYLKDDGFLPIDKLKSVGRLCTTSLCPSGQQVGQVCNDKSNIGWISKDSTTLDAQKAVRMCLDSAPMNSYIKDYWGIYDKNSDINRYKSVYYFREDLPGQIQYYIDLEMTNPFFPPLFPPNTKALGAVYVDPMNNTHYDFRRSTGTCGPQQPLNCDDCEIAEFRDLQFHREDMLANIMRPRNRREYEPIHFNFMTRYHPQ